MGVSIILMQVRHRVEILAFDSYGFLYIFLRLGFMPFLRHNITPVAKI